MKEYKVGEIFEHDGKIFQCVEDSTEVGCGFCCALRGKCEECVCSSEERQDEADVHFVEVTELKDGMLFRAKSGELYRIAADLKEGEKCACETGNRYSCSDIKSQIPVSLLAGYRASRLLFIPVDESGDPDKSECARHISLFVIEVKEGEVCFRIDKQTHRGSNFSNQLDSRRFAGKNGYKLVSSYCPEWWADTHTLFVRGDVKEEDDATLMCSLEEFAKISEVVSEYNSTADMPWPHYGDTYYYLTKHGEVSYATYQNDEFDTKLKNYGNFFASRAEAEEAGKRVREALRDE